MYRKLVEGLVGKMVEFEGIKVVRGCDLGLIYSRFPLHKREEAAGQWRYISKWYRS
jgi:hypothetical protein